MSALTYTLTNNCCLVLLNKDSKVQNTIALKIGWNKPGCAPVFYCWWKKHRGHPPVNGVNYKKLLVPHIWYHSHGAWASPAEEDFQNLKQPHLWDCYNYGENTDRENLDMSVCCSWNEPVFLTTGISQIRVPTVHVHTVIPDWANGMNTCVFWWS